MSLARPGDPLVGMNKSIAPEGYDDSAPDKPSITIPVINRLLVKGKMSIPELPTDTKTQSIINAIMVYHLLGLTDNEVALCLGTNIRDVQAVKQLAAYQDTFELLFGELISTNSNSLQSRIAAMAGEAVEHVMELARVKNDDESVPPIVKLKANQDILDRAGLSSDALFGRNADKSDDTSLRVVVSTGKDNSTSINVDFKRK